MYNVLGKLSSVMAPEPGIFSLDRVETAKYIYLADGTKIGVSLPDGSETMYRGSFILHRNAVGDVELQTLILPEGIAVPDQNSMKMYIFVTDRLGSTRAVVDLGEREVCEENDYYAFGSRIPGGEQLIENRWRYSGKEEQEALCDLPYIDFGARLYNPRLGRWLSPDPLAEKYYSLSPFNYCGNDPVNRFDPDGMSPKDKTVGFLLGIITNVVPLSDGLRDVYSPDDPYEYNATLKSVDTFAKITGATMAAIGAGGLDIGNTLSMSGVVVSSTGIGAVAGIPAAGVGLAIDASSAAIGIAGAGLMMNASNNSSEGYDRGKQESGTATPSKTLWSSKGKNKSHLDVENPGNRKCQIHYQDANGNKYIYDIETGTFKGAPNKINELKYKDKSFERALEKGIQYLGEND